MTFGHLNKSEVEHELQLRQTELMCNKVLINEALLHNRTKDAEELRKNQLHILTDISLLKNRV